MKRNNLHRKRLFDWWLSSGGDTAFSVLYEDLTTARYEDDEIVMYEQ